MTNDTADAMPPAAADLIRALCEAGWTLTEGSKAPTHAFRPADGCGLTVWMSATDTEIKLNIDAERRRLADGTVRKPWNARTYGLPPVTVLAAVAAANAADQDDPKGPGRLLAAAGWTRSSHWSRDWQSPDGELELIYTDDDFDCADMPWSIDRRPELEFAVSTSDSTPATVIAALALTDAAEPAPGDLARDTAAALPPSTCTR